MRRAAGLAGLLLTAATAAPPSPVIIESSYCEVVSRSSRYSEECKHTTAYTPSGKAGPPAQCLVTGLGRTGTYFTASLLNTAGWQINHDDKKNFCPCPGAHGSVAHPYAWGPMAGCPLGYWTPDPRHLFNRVVHQRRTPLRYINSRAVPGPQSAESIFSRCNMKPVPLDDYSDTDAGGGTGGGATLTAKLRYMRSARFALRKYVLQNTFVGAHADWAFNIEDLSSPELCVELCENCGLGAIPRSGGATGCPTASEFKDIIDNKMKTDANHDHTHHSAWTWEALFDVDPDFTTAALMLGESYGYETKHLEPVQGFKIICGFADDDVHGGAHPLWDCRLDRGSGGGGAALAPTMMHPKHFTPPSVKTRADSRLKGEDPFNLGVDIVRDPQYQCMIDPQTGRRDCATVMCHPKWTHCQCKFEGRLVSQKEVAKVSSFFKVDGKMSIGKLRAEIASFPKISGTKLDALDAYQATIIQRCKGIEPGPVSGAAETRPELSDRNFWARWKAKPRQMLAIAGAVYIPIEWRRITDMWPWTTGAVVARLRQLVSVFDGLDKNMLHILVVQQGTINQLAKALEANSLPFPEMSNCIIFDSRGADDRPTFPIPLLHSTVDVAANRRNTAAAGSIAATAGLPHWKNLFFAGKCTHSVRCWMEPVQSLAGPSVRPCGQAIQKEDWNQAMVSSTWSLAPIGSFPTSFRQSDTLAAGKLPVVIGSDPSLRLDKKKANCPHCCPAFREGKAPYDAVNFTSPSKARVWLPYQDLGLEWHKVGMVLRPADVKLAPLAKALRAAESSVPERLEAAKAWSALFEPDAVLEYVLYIFGKVRSRKKWQDRHKDLLLAACITSARAKSNPDWD